MRIFYTYTLFLLVTSHLFGLSLSFEEAIEQFTQHNYDMKLARHEADKSYTSLITAKERPNPLLNGSYEFLKTNNHFSDMSPGSNAQATVIFAHPIETAGKRDRRIDLAQHTIAYSQFLYDMTKQEQLSLLIDSYYTLLGAQTDLANAEANKEGYTRVLAIAKVKHANGFLSAIDYQKLALLLVTHSPLKCSIVEK